MRKLILLINVCFVVLILNSGFAQTQRRESSIGIAVEYTNHAASAYIARNRGYYEKAGLNLSIYESYATGTALAAALVRGDIQVAFICLVPAINAFANAGVPIKIVAGTHKYGYGLAVNPQKIKTVADLTKPGIRLGCVQAGSAADIVLHKMIDKFDLNRKAVLKNIRRMNPSKQIMAAKMGRLDAVFVPEHWTTLSETAGLQMLLTAKDVWPGMQGSVLVVKEDLLVHQPETVRKLVHVLQATTAWAHEHAFESAKLLAEELLQSGKEVWLTDTEVSNRQKELFEDIMRRSMGRLEYATGIDPIMVQDTIDYMVLQGYIRTSFKAEKILDLRFIK